MNEVKAVKGRNKKKVIWALGGSGRERKKGGNLQVLPKIGKGGKQGGGHGTPPVSSHEILTCAL